jgi:hypothetical protein
MAIDPDLAAVLLAVALGTAPALLGGRRVLLERRARRFCRSCGRRVIQGLRQCDCDAG